MEEQSSLAWTEEALLRLEKVPVGFMRKMTRKRIEEYAKKNLLTEINLKTVEKVIETSRAGMGSMMGGDASEKQNPESGFSSPLEGEKKSLYYFCFVCGYVVKNKIPEICPVCESKREKFSELKAEFVTPSSMEKLKWTNNALKLLKDVPADFRQEMTRWEMEGYARKKGYFVVSADLMEERYAVWENIADKFKSSLNWDKEVKERIKNIPAAIRGMVMREMELLALKKEEKSVSLSILQEIKEKWGGSREFHLKWME